MCIRDRLEIARGADLTENLTTLAKTGLWALSEEQVCALENYAYTWAPTAAAWRGGSTGGTDIIAAIVNKYKDVTLG